MNETQAPLNYTLKLIDAALSLQQAGEWEQSNEVLRKAEQNTSEYAPVHLLLGINYQELGDAEKAEQCLRQALKLAPDYGEALQTLGLILANQGRLEEAILLLRARWGQAPGNPQVLEALSSALLQVGEVEDAVRILRGAWEQTQEEEPGVLYGRFLIQLQRLEQAEIVLREVQQTCLCPRTLAELALVLLLRDKNAEAAEILERAIEMDPNFDRAWRGLSGCYTRLGKHQQALEAAEQALRLDDKHCRNWLVKAVALLGLGQYEEALRSVRQGLAFVRIEDEETRPVLFQLYEHEVAALLNLGYVEEALQCLAENQQRFPQVRQFAEMRVNLLLWSKQYTQALAVLEQAQTHGIEMILMKYRLLHMMGQSDEAWAVIRGDIENVTSEQQSRRLGILSGIALEAYMNGEVEAAYTILEQLHEFAPDDARLLNNLGFLLTGRGELTQAEQQLMRVTQSPEADDWQAITSLNLAYLYLIQTQYDKAAVALREAQSGLEKKPGTNSVSRVAYWREGEILPEYTTYPLEFYPVQLSIWANQATLCLVRGELTEAASLAQRIVDEMPEKSLGYRVLGWVRRAQDQPDAAREAWQRAQAYAEHPDEQGTLTAWIEALPDSA